MSGTASFYTFHFNAFGPPRSLFFFSNSSRDLAFALHNSERFMKMKGAQKRWEEIKLQKQVELEEREKDVVILE